MLRFIIHTYTLFFLGQLVRTTYTRNPNRSRLGYCRFNMLHHFFPFPHPHLYYLYHSYAPFDHTRFPGQFYIIVLIHAFLNNCILQYTSCGLGW